MEGAAEGGFEDDGDGLADAAGLDEIKGMTGIEGLADRWADSLGNLAFGCILLAAKLSISESSLKFQVHYLITPLIDSLITYRSKKNHYWKNLRARELVWKLGPNGQH